jgi:hypothetical protein
MADEQRAAEISTRSEFLWDAGGQAFFEAIGEACWIIVLVLCAVAILVWIYRTWFGAKRYRMDEKVV